MTHPLSAKVGVFGLLFAGVRPIHGVVLLELHGLHLLLDGVHCVFLSVFVWERKNSHYNRDSLMRREDTA